MDYIKHILAKSLKYTGVVTIFNKLNSEVIIIITFHRILPEAWLSLVPWEKKSITPESLKSLIEFLSEYEIIALKEAVEILQRKSGGSGRKPFVVITFDDGYFDFYRFAFPVLREMKVPTTLFLATGPVERKEGLWWEEISIRVWNSPEQVSRISRGWGRHESLQREIERFSTSRDHEAWKEIQRYIRKLSASERDYLQESIVEEVPVTVTKECIGMVSVDSIKEMSSAGVSMQAHTVTHRYLDDMIVTDLARELSESKEKLGGWTGEKVDFLAYPAGRLPGPEGMEIVRRNFRAALSTKPGCNHPGADLYRLNRKDAFYFLSDKRICRDVAAVEISGIPDIFFARPE